jgi:hypothetical protein
MLDKFIAASCKTGALYRHFSNTVPKIEVKISTETTTLPASQPTLAKSPIGHHETESAQEESEIVPNDVSATRDNETIKNISRTNAANTFFSNYEATVIESHLNEDVGICHKSSVLASYAARDLHENGDFDQLPDEMAEHKPVTAGDASTLDTAIARGDADLIARCILSIDEASDFSYLQALSDDAFTEKLMLLQPSTFVNRITSVHQELSSSKVRQMGITPVNEVARAYSDLLMQIVTTRRSGGSKLSLTDHTILLRSARDLGNHKMAREVWNALFQDGHSPDVDCYNYYMAAHVWNGRHRSQHRQKVRVVPFNAMNRQREQRRAKFRALDVDSADTLTMARHIFDVMSRDGVEPNEESYRVLIVAAARQGRMDNVNTILRNIWAVDVDAIQRGANEAPKVSPKRTENVPLKPCGALLVAIAHAFGINNDILTALRVVDHIAQRHRIPIDEEIWSQLFEWTFVLSIDRTGTSKKDGSNIGQLPSQTLQSLWDTMIGEPYDIQPTMRMYDLLIKDLFARSQTPAMVAKMMEAVALYESHRHEASAAFKRFKTVAAKYDDDKQDAKNVPSLSLEHLRREWEYLNLLRRRDVYLLKRWTSLILKSFDEWHRVDFVDRHYACGLPALLWEWREWAPTTVKYEMPTAFVEFDIRTKEEIAFKAQRKVDAQMRQRRILDTAPRLLGQDWL